MSEPTIIKAGYRLTATSWENDADHYAAEVMDGLTEAEVRMYVELGTYLGSGYGENDFGNMYVGSSRDDKVVKVRQVLSEVIKKHRGAFENDDHFEFAVCEPIEFVNDKLLGYSDDYLMRVLQEIKVEFIPNDIVIQDVSDQFGC